MSYDTAKQRHRGVRIDIISHAMYGVFCVRMDGLDNLDNYRRKFFDFNNPFIRQTSRYTARVKKKIKLLTLRVLLLFRDCDDALRLKSDLALESG